MAELSGQDFPTVIGSDASFKGELTFEKGLRLLGKFEGKINTPKVAFPVFLAKHSMQQTISWCIELAHHN